MDPLVVGLLGVIGLLTLLALGVHIGVALLVSGFAGLTVLNGFQATMPTVVSGFYHKISNPALITLPLFVLMGYLASGGGVSHSIYETLNLWLGGFRSGVGIATVLGCTAFGTVCGSSLVTAAVFARISAPEMRRQGYDKRLAYAICASAGAIGMLIPPSMLAIVYGMLSGVSIGKLLMAGVAPGVLLAFFFSVTIVIVGKLRPESIRSADLTSATWAQRVRSLGSWWPIYLVAASIFGGIYGGVFSPSEASAVAAFVLLIVFLLKVSSQKNPLRRGEMLRELWASFGATATTSALVFLVLGGATVFSQFLVLTGVTNQLSNFVKELGLQPGVLIVVFCLVYLLLGCFLDSVSMLCVTIPVFNPIVNAAGVDPIWYATVVIVAIEIGLITPPVGLNLFSTKGSAEPDVTLEDIIGGVLPFFAAFLLLLVLLLSVPWLSTFLPRFVA
jgi:tripartite ATP-independent transporter DctM subunit